MRFFINGYFGYGNAGDEAVLAAMLDHLRELAPTASFVVTSGDPVATRALHGCEAIERANPRELVREMRACSLFVSGGGSLVQDVTSLGSAVYYTTLLRMARALGVPSMVYAQGVGPLLRPVTRRMTRAAFASASIVTVRDQDSRDLLASIGLKREVEVTADPVWALDAPSGDDTRAAPGQWLAALRSWPGREDAALVPLGEALCEGARRSGARLRFVAMQPGCDHRALEALRLEPDDWLDPHGSARRDEPGGSRRPDDARPDQMRAGDAREVVAALRGADLVIAMRLHALIFAASGGVPVVALDYDPKVAALARSIGAPLLASPEAATGPELAQALAEAAPLAPDLRERMRQLARRNAELAVKLASRRDTAPP